MASFESNPSSEPMLATYTTSESDYANNFTNAPTEAEEEAKNDALVSRIAIKLIPTSSQRHHKDIPSVAVVPLLQ